MSIAPDARDTQFDFGKELTSGNPFSVRFFEERNRADCSAVDLTSADQAWIGNLGRRFLISEIFTFDDPAKSLLGKMLDWPVLSPESEDSLRSVSAGERPLRKRGAAT
jgi:hypothetical protein